MDGGAGLVLNIHLAPQQDIFTVHYFTRGHRLGYQCTETLLVQSVHSSRRIQKVGAGDRHIHIRIHIYIYNSDSLYKVREEKREGGTLLGHHTADVA